MRLSSLRKNNTLKRKLFGRTPKGDFLRCPDDGFEPPGLQCWISLPLVASGSSWLLLAAPGSSCVLLAAFGSSRLLFTPIWAIWAYLGLSGPHWASLGLSGPIWAIWAHLGLSGPIWAHLSSQLASELPGLLRASTFCEAPRWGSVNPFC